MNISKHMEAIFVVATVALGVAAYASAALPSHTAAPALTTASVPAVPQIDAVPMHVVVVTAKRLTPAEKAALDE